MERKVVKIYSAESSIQAKMILGILGGNQVPTCKKDIGSSGIMNVCGTNFLDGEEIYVAGEDAEQALEVLGGMGF